MSTTSPEASALLGSGQAILELVEEQVARGPRVPGSAAHDALARRLEEELREHGAEVTVQEFPVAFRGSLLRCRNVVGVLPARRPAAPGLLLATHYDCRFRADRDPDRVRRDQPIPGANDGASGTAVLRHLLPLLAGGALDRDVAVAFVDAEDLGGIDGKEYALGSEHLASHPVPGFLPAEVIVLDMVGGRDMVLDIDAHVASFPGSRELTGRLFRLGLGRGWPPFARTKPNRVKYIISDHTPFLRRGIPACILIDIDYPEWHTQADLPAAMSPQSLEAIEGALRLFLKVGSD